MLQEHFVFIPKFSKVSHSEKQEVDVQVEKPAEKYFTSDTATVPSASPENILVVKISSSS